MNKLILVGKWGQGICFGELMLAFTLCRGSFCQFGSKMDLNLFKASIKDINSVSANKPTIDIQQIAEDVQKDL